MRLEGRTVIVTGGASGLGGATVDMIVAAGGRAVIVDINEQTGAAKAAQHGTNAHFVKTDVTSDAEMQRAVDAGVKTFGAIHGWFARRDCIADARAAKDGVRLAPLPRRSPSTCRRHAFNAIRLRRRQWPATNRNAGERAYRGPAHGWPLRLAESAGRLRGAAHRSRRR